MKTQMMLTLTLALLPLAASAAPAKDITLKYGRGLQQAAIRYLLELEESDPAVKKVFDKLNAAVHKQWDGHSAICSESECLQAVITDATVRIGESGAARSVSLAVLQSQRNKAPFEDNYTTAAIAQISYNGKMVLDENEEEVGTLSFESLKKFKGSILK